MSLRPDPVGPVPEETARVARAAFPRGTMWMRLRDELVVIYEDVSFRPLFATRGRPAEAPWRLAHHAGQRAESRSSAGSWAARHAR